MAAAVTGSLELPQEYMEMCPGELNRQGGDKSDQGIFIVGTITAIFGYAALRSKLDYLNDLKFISDPGRQSVPRQLIRSS